MNREEIARIGEIQKTVHQLARDKGWYDDGLPPFGERIALIHSELSEALEEYRNHRPFSEVRIENGKPEGVIVELADVVIRVLDMCGAHDIPIGEALEYASAERRLGDPLSNGGSPLASCFGDMIARLHIHASRAAAAYFEGRQLTYISHPYLDTQRMGIPMDLARLIADTFSWANGNGADMFSVIHTKHHFNSDRPRRHGGKKC